MLRTFSAACAAVTMTAFAFNTADAHGYISFPRVVFKNNAIGSDYVTRITASVNIAFAGLKWNDTPEKNVETFTNAFPHTGYKSLRDMLDQQVPGCGNSRIDTPPVDVSRQTVMTWQNDQAHVGFIGSHHGPCEVWIDNILVVHQKDCVAAYGSGFPSRLNVDFSKCTGKCILTFYWLTLHEPDWQIYKQCVPIVNKSGTQVPGTVKPAGKSSYGRQNRALRTIEDARTHLANVAKDNRADSRV